MADDKTHIWIIGFVSTAIAAMYAIFIKHIWKHVVPEDIVTMQKKATCDEIVKRFDENHKEVCSKLDRIFEKI